MKEIIEYLNSNAILTALVTMLVGWVFSTFTTLIISNRQRNERVNEELRREYNKRIENRAELFLDNTVRDDGTIPNIHLFLTDFNVDVDKSARSVLFNYSDDILDSSKYKELVFYVKNIGKSDISYLDICVANQRKYMLVDFDQLEFFVKNNAVNYSFCYDRKVLKEKYIMIRISYLEESQIFSAGSCELVLLYKDTLNNLYEQSFFILNENIYEPRLISYSEYRNSVTTETAIDCFLDPWKW